MFEAAHRRHEVRVEEDVGALRRAVASMAGRLPGLRPGQPELAATELATNLVRHTTDGGYVLCREADGGIELLAVDRGPGMRPGGVPPWAIARGDDASLPPFGGGGLGVGLAGVRRLSSIFDCYAAPGGTVVLARVGPAVPPADVSWRWGGVNVPYGGTGESGDAWAVSPGPPLGALVVDGLGHGPAAAEAARAAVTEFAHGPLTDLETFVRRANEAMRGTRGGVLAVCSIAPERNQVTYAGVGNIAGRVLGGARREHLVSQHGTLGTHLAPPAARQSTYAWPPGATLVLTTDGVDTRWDPGSYPDLLRHHPVVVAATIHRDHTRGTDDAAILVVHDTGGTEGGAR